MYKANPQPKKAAEMKSYLDNPEPKKASEMAKYKARPQVKLAAQKKRYKLHSSSILLKVAVPIICQPHVNTPQSFCI